MLQKFLNLRKTDPTWFWLIVILTLGLIFFVVLAMGLLFYIIGRKIHDLPQPQVRQIDYHGLIHIAPPPTKIKVTMGLAKFVELDVKYPKKDNKDLSRQADKATTRFEKQENRWASLFKRRAKNPIKVWNARLKLNKQQKKDYETQIKIIQNQQKDLKSEMEETANPEHKKNVEVHITKQDNTLRNVENIKDWNDRAIEKIKDKIDSL